MSCADSALQNGIAHLGMRGRVPFVMQVEIPDLSLKCKPIRKSYDQNGQPNGGITWQKVHADWPPCKIWGVSKDVQQCMELIPFVIGYILPVWNTSESR